ncbi:MAG: hypothetical protein H6682_09390 [Candidatus Eisenbacteria bacterium]|nr:hypothetical protein [Candidatus Eisenbacteria bacterium]
MRIRALSFLAFCLLVPLSTAIAGPNASGVHILHVNDGLVWSDSGEYCGESGLDACGGADTRVDEVGRSIFFLLAAFPSTASPRLFGTTAGIDYDPSLLIVEAWQTCADFELPSGDSPPYYGAWPNPNSGNAMTWNTVQTDHLVELGWFAVYRYVDDETIFTTMSSPVAGSFFADDSVPSILDPVVDFGALGFGTDGYLPCPGGPPFGACCFVEHCEISTQEGCEAEYGTWNGSDSCEPNPCIPTPLLPMSWGKVKEAFVTPSENGR